MENTVVQNGHPGGAARHPIHPALAPIPVGFFVVALFTDVTYWRTADPLWTTMSSWLLLAGLVMAGVAVIAGLIDLLGDRSLRRLRPVWLLVLGNGLAFLLSVLNFVFHVRDGYSAVAPVGPLLSAAVVLILLFTGAMEWGLVYRRPVAVADGGVANSKEI
jgi:uncharacterized membrane protein